MRSNTSGAQQVVLGIIVVGLLCLVIVSINAHEKLLGLVDKLKVVNGNTWNVVIAAMKVIAIVLVFVISIIADIILVLFYVFLLMLSYALGGSISSNDAKMEDFRTPQTFQHLFATTSSKQALG